MPPVRTPKSAPKRNSKAAKASREQSVEDAYDDADGKEGHGYNYWERQLSSYNKIYQPWERKCDKLMDVYTGANSTTSNPRAKYNIFFSVVQTLVPAIYARTPRPDVSRRFKDTDPAARVAALLLERALEYEIDYCSDYRSAISHCVFDFLTAGRACAWLRYEPHIKAKELDQPTDGLETTEDIDEPNEELIGEESKVDYVHYKELAYTGGARTWEEVAWVARYVYMDKEAVKARFGAELADIIPLDAQPDSRKHDLNKLDNRDLSVKQAEIIEIWCKQTKMVYWLNKGIGRIIDKRDDPLGLPNFFPCAKPLFFGCINDSLVPNPMYVQLQDACVSLNILAERQRALIEGMKLRGVYDAQYKELARLLSEGEDNSLVPVINYAQLSEKGGLNNAIQLLDMTQQAAALQATFEAMSALQQQVYDLSGVSDVMRGMSDPSETATAQTLKSVNGQNRLKTMQLAIAQFAGDLLKIKANLMCKQYSDETILKISCADQLSMVDQQLIPQALALLRSDPDRGFKVEVTADSLILMDEVQEKSDRMEFLSAIGGYFQQALPLVGQSPELAPLAIEFLKFTATSFKAGKQLEGMVDQVADSFREQFEKTKDQPKPPPVEIQKLQMQLQSQQQLEQAKMQAQAQLEQAKSQAKQLEMQAQLEFDRQKAQIDAEVERQKQLFQSEQEKERLILEDQRDQRELAAKMKLEQQKMLIDRNTRLMELHYKNAGALSVEQVKDGFSDGADDETRELALAEASGHPMASAMDAMDGANEQIAALLQQVMDHHRAPRRVIRDEQGNMVGAEIVPPQARQIAPDKRIALAQRLPDHHPGAAIANKAIDGAGEVAQVLMAMLENMKKPKRVVRDEAGNLIGAEQWH